MRGAVRNGASEVEIREALLQARFVILSVHLFHLFLKSLGWSGRKARRDGNKNGKLMNA